MSDIRVVRKESVRGDEAAVGFQCCRRHLAEAATLRSRSDRTLSAPHSPPGARRVRGPGKGDDVELELDFTWSISQQESVLAADTEAGEHLP